MKLLYFFIFLVVYSSVSAQNFNGQWKGGFNESSYGFSGMSGNNIDYVLELETTGSTVTGFSYTYFTEGAKKFYTICRLSGTLNKSTKEIEVTEVERVKFNTPPDFQNCFQTHKLHYVQDSADVEILKGTWIPAPNQTGNCGYGTTLLSRRIISRSPLEMKPPEKATVRAEPRSNPVPVKPKYIAPKKVPVKTVPKNDLPLASRPKVGTPKNNKPLAGKPVIKTKPLLVKKEQPTKNIRSEIPGTQQTDPIILPVTKFEPRRKDIIKTIPIVQKTFQIDFYDNGEIDGDSITVFYNNRVVLSHKMLTTKPISLTLALDENVKENVVTMYADNLGTIPPNTALMIVTDGEKRYEVRITSDTEKSGSVVFVHGDK